jgi:hypothetical protein
MSFTASWECFLCYRVFLKRKPNLMFKSSTSNYLFHKILWSIVHYAILCNAYVPVSICSIGNHNCNNLPNRCGFMTEQHKKQGIKKTATDQSGC